MNIFVTSSNPVTAAMNLCDAHVCKMIVESCQLLSTQDSLDGLTEGRYKSTHINHPCRKCLENPWNYLWLCFHLNTLLEGYRYRFHKRHKCREMFDNIWYENIHSWQEIGLESWTLAAMSTFPKCMPEEFKTGGDDISGVIASYKNYYRYKKQTLKRWKYTNKEEPEWLTREEADCI